MQVVPHEFGLGWSKDPPDHRDLLWEQIASSRMLPTRYVWGAAGPVLNQGQTPQCVAYSTASMKAVEEWVEQHKPGTYGPWYGFATGTFYQWCKQNDGAPNQAGTSIRVAMTLLKNYGYPANAIRGRVSDAPSPISERRYPISSYVRLMTIHDLKQAIFAIGPCCFGMDVDEGIYYPRRAANGVFLPPPNGRPVGGHAMVATGFDETRQAFRIKNSWSSLWGDKGFAWMPYTWFERYDYDAWKAVDLRNA